MQQLGLDLPAARRYWHLIHEHPDFVRRLCAVMKDGPEAPADQDPDFMIYSGGFFSDADKRLMSRVRSLNASQLSEQLSSISGSFHDARLPELLFRYRARNSPQSLTAAEQQRWLDFCRQRLLPEQPEIGKRAGLTAAECLAQIKVLSVDPGLADRDRHILDELHDWVNAICGHLAK